jgi:ribosomal protein S18 acetylase RimI-like enzyme
VIIASLNDTPIGYSRLGWYSSSADTRLYYQVSFLREEYRGTGHWQTMVEQNEECLRQVAAEHDPAPRQFFQAWSSDNTKDWAAVLEKSGYKVMRRFNNMLHDLNNIPDNPLPEGLEVCAIKPEELHKVWEAQKEMNAGLFENVEEDWLEEKYPAWLENTGHDPRFWQIAWDGDQLAGMVLAHIDEKENEKRNRKHGYTEHIYVRPQWRKRGVAGALISRSLQALKDQGMTEAELGVDAENESAAFRLYQNMGYKTFRVDTWHRKPMEGK